MDSWSVVGCGVVWRYGMAEEGRVGGVGACYLGGEGVEDEGFGCRGGFGGAGLGEVGEEEERFGVGKRKGWRGGCTKKEEIVFVHIICTMFLRVMLCGSSA